MLLNCFSAPKPSPFAAKIPILSYREYDFTKCRCYMTLYSMYKEIVYHSNGARMAEKHIEAQIEWSNCCMKVANIPKAIQMLESVQQQIKVC